MSEGCPDCGHSWGAHQARDGDGRGVAFGQSCQYSAYKGHGCSCRRMSPAIIAENEHARSAWNAFMGRSVEGDPE